MFSFSYAVNHVAILWKHNIRRPLNHIMIFAVLIQLPIRNAATALPIQVTTLFCLTRYEWTSVIQVQSGKNSLCRDSNPGHPM